MRDLSCGATEVCQSALFFFKLHVCCRGPGAHRLHCVFDHAVGELFELFEFRRVTEIEAGLLGDQQVNEHSEQALS